MASHGYYTTPHWRRALSGCVEDLKFIEPHLSPWIRRAFASPSETARWLARHLFRRSVERPGDSRGRGAAATRGELVAFERGSGRPAARFVASRLNGDRRRGDRRRPDAARAGRHWLTIAASNAPRLALQLCGNHSEGLPNSVTAIGKAHRPRGRRAGRRARRRDRSRRITRRPQPARRSGALNRKASRRPISRPRRNRRTDQAAAMEDRSYGREAAQEQADTSANAFFDPGGPLSVTPTLPRK